MRIMLFKRFESSVYAFRETVRRLLRIHETFLAALDRGIVPAGEEAQAVLYESDRDEEQVLWDTLERLSGRYRVEDFDADRLRSDLAQDIRILREILALVEPITPAQDDKLQTLLRWLDDPALRDGKRLIFTQYADTARYLYESLDPARSRPDVEVIYSREKNKAEIVGRFAPRSNPQQRPLDGALEIQTLIATDVLSEGLNLQDCDKLINYDLHWNPVRLIQRFGRIDRIGTEHETVYGYNFLPETGLDQGLGLQEKLARRIQEIHDTIGEDAAILDPGERLNEEAMYTIYGQGEVGQYEDDEGDAFVDLNEAEEIIRQLREDQPELFRLITEMRDGMRCGRRKGGDGVVVFCRSGDYKQLYLVNGAGEILSRDASHILSVLKCEPDTPAEPLPEGYNVRVMQIKKRFADEVAARRAERQHTLSLTKAQQYVLRELRVMHGQSEDEALRSQVEALEAVLRRPGPRPAVRSELNRLRREGITGNALLLTLSRMYSLFGLELEPSASATPADENDALPRIVCSEALIL
jgi:hypothetical protein